MSTATMADVIDIQVEETPQAKPPVVAQQSAIAQQRASLAVTPVDLLRMAVERNADMVRLKEMMDLYERWQAKQVKCAYDDAFACFKAEAVKVIKGRQRTNGPLRGTSYAELCDVVDAVTPALSKYRLSSSWKITRDDPTWIEVTCYLRHADGHEESVSMGGPPDEGPGRNTLQARISTTTYLKRDTLKSICGVAEKGDDDDGGGGADPAGAAQQAANQGKPQGASKQTQQPNFYDQTKFDANKDTWREMVKSGRKTAAAMIQFIESKGAKLTVDQQNTIDSWSHEND
ncbi:single-stranded DNA-binding protein [Paraburkholderia sp. Ac-20342]|uniref:ERF family protein n=1 Tax=Paraburkholderia sp. Ac-20342 TaxID=2703889 RepID=UPI00198246FA|nr:ERF family protein [Paraburkholderia sp. Ac-20342]MBN3848672.1 single-stranded DNA-binding protein [Paraburkholderia sp. Ac-20342]